MIAIEKELKQILANCINNKTIQLNQEFIPNDELLNSGSIKWNVTLKTYELNFLSSNVNSVLLIIACERLNTVFPINISDAIKFVDNFEKEIKKPQTNVSWAGLIELKNNFEIFLLSKLHTEYNIDIVDFFYSLPKKRKDRETHLFSFEDSFFKTLSFIDIECGKLFEIIQKNYSINHNEHNIIIFCRNIGKINPKLAINLYEYVKENGLNDIELLIPNILIGLYDNDEKSTFEKAKNLFIDNQKLAIIFFGAVNLKSLTEINDVLSLINSSDQNDEVILSKCIFFYQNLLRNDLINDELIKLCFEELYNIFEFENENLRNSIIQTLSWGIDGYEKERYDFLQYILNKTQNINFIKDYFSTFKDPFYYFHLFSEANSTSGFRTDINIFESGLSHLIDKAPEETEKYLLDTISHENKRLRIGGIKLLLSAYTGIYRINLLKLDNEINQLRAIETIVNFPHSIESFIPMLLDLRKSKFPEVIKNLQQKLSDLVFNAYQEYLYELILGNIDNNDSDDINFIKPIKKSLEHYEDIKKFKASINDLNPRENERDLMDLYYRLEHENQAIMMNEMKEGNGSFLQYLAKSTIIVRAHSWKLDGDDEVRPLGKVEHSVRLDNRVYKNPDLFEYNLNNLKTKF